MFKHLFGSCTKSNDSMSENSNQKHQETPVVNNIFESKINSPLHSCARFDSGKVYMIAPDNTEYLIGYYSNTEILNSQNRQIALISLSDEGSSGIITLSYVGEYQRVTALYEDMIKSQPSFLTDHFRQELTNKQNAIKTKPLPGVLESWRFGYIEEKATQKCIGELLSKSSKLSNEDIICGMAAAFICLQAEARDDQNKFSHYYSF